MTRNRNSPCSHAGSTLQHASCSGNHFRRAYKNVMYITLGLCGCVHGMLTMPMANGANSCWLVSELFTPHWANKNVIAVHLHYRSITLTFIMKFHSPPEFCVCVCGGGGGGGGGGGSTICVAMWSEGNACDTNQHW